MSDALSPGTLAERLGITVLEWSADRTVGTMPVAGNTQPAGLLHGGASAALAESLASYAAYKHAGGPIVGVDLNITHHRSAREGIVTGVATPLFLGRRIATYDVAITDEAGKLVASARLTCLVLADDSPAS